MDCCLCLSRKMSNLSKEKGVIMGILNFVIAVVALIIAVLAFQRTGGTKELKKTTAELLTKMEKKDAGRRSS